VMAYITGASLVTVIGVIFAIRQNYWRGVVGIIGKSEASTLLNSEGIFLEPISSNVGDNGIYKDAYLIQKNIEREMRLITLSNLANLFANNVKYAQRIRFKLITRIILNHWPSIGCADNTIRNFTVIKLF
jgi:signal peptidase I